MTTDTYQIGPDARLDVRIDRGSIVVLPGDPGSIRVELDGGGADDVRVDATPGSVTVRTPGRLMRGGGRIDVRLTVPADVRSSLGIASGGIEVRAPLAELQASAASGDLRVTASVGRPTLKTASGDVHADELPDRAVVTSGSGDITVGRVTGAVRLAAASGDIEIESLAGDLSCKTASGDITVRRMEEGRLEFRTASGDTTVGIPPGRRVRYDVKAVTGRLRLPGAPPEPLADPVEPKPVVRIEGRSVSGDTTLEHAR